MNERQRDQKLAMGREREKEWGKTYKYTPHRRRLVYFFFLVAAAQRRPVPMPDCHGISPTCKRGEIPRVVPVPKPAPALVTRGLLMGPEPSGGDGVPMPDVSLAVRRVVRLLGAIELLGVSAPLREGLRAGARLGSISRASSRTSTAPSLRRRAATVSCMP